MPLSLWTLIRLHFKGVFRRVGREVRKPRGVIFLILGILALVLWLGSMAYGTSRTGHADPELVRTVAPFGILGFCLGNLLASFGDNAVTFTPAEVDFLFPGPYSRRTLLIYKIVKTGLGTIISALFFTIILRRYSQWWVACAVGAWLTIQFMQLFAMCVMMVAQTAGERAYSAARRGVLLVVLGVAIVVGGRFAVGMRQSPLDMARMVHRSMAGEVALAPFDVLARAITARTLPELAMWGAVGLLIDAGMLALVLGLDTNYLETAATVSQRRYDRIRRIRQGGIGAAGGKGPARIRVKMLPWLGGVGPVAWRQMTGAVRSSRRLLILVAIVAVVIGSTVMRVGEEKSALGPLVGAAVWMNLFFVSTLKFDFHDDLDRLDLLRSLPLRPWAVSAGELVAPVVALCILQGALLIAASVVARETREYLPVFAAFAAPFNVLLVGIENLLFLMFPLRQAGLIAGDMQMFGRQMVVFLCKILLLLAGLGIAAVIGTIGYIAGGQSWVAFGAVAWLGLCGVALAIIPLLARVYAKFDPSVDTPA